VADLWLPGAQVVNLSAKGLALSGGPRVAVWHTTETGKGTAAAVAKGANMARWPAHLVWDPYTGEIMQLLPANVAASALITHNRDGAVVVQVEAVGKAADAPLATSPLLGLDVILAWLDSHGVPRVWPAGAPLAYGAGGAPAYGAGNGQRDAWGRSGHYGHSQVPGNDHGDPGRVDLARWSPVPAAEAAPAGISLSRWNEPPAGYLLWKGSRDPVQGRWTFVHWVQERLNLTGARLSVDGDFGQLTETALQVFQRQSGINPDGVFGPQTQNRLR